MCWLVGAAVEPQSRLLTALLVVGLGLGGLGAYLLGLRIFRRRPLTLPRRRQHDARPRAHRPRDGALMARRSRRTLGMVAAVLLGTMLLAGPAAAGAGALGRPSASERTDRSTARRVLVFSVPYVSWADVDAADTPNLDRFVRAAGVAGLSTRVDARETSLGDGYATIGAGTRTVSVDDASAGGLMVDEPFGAATAGETYTQRTGRASGDAIVQTAIVDVVGANAALHYDTEVGALAAALDDAGIGRAVIANGDGEDPDAARSTRRQHAGPRPPAGGDAGSDGRRRPGPGRAGGPRPPRVRSRCAVRRAPRPRRRARRVPRRVDGSDGHARRGVRPGARRRVTAPTSPPRRTIASSPRRCTAVMRCSARCWTRSTSGATR